MRLTTDNRLRIVFGTARRWREQQVCVIVLELGQLYQLFHAPFRLVFMTVAASKRHCLREERFLRHPFASRRFLERLEASDLLARNTSRCLCADAQFGEYKSNLEIQAYFSRR